MKIWMLTGVLVLALGGCKKVSTDCDYIVEPRLQAEEKGEYRADLHTVSFAFYADTLTYRPASYEEARAGRLSSPAATAAPLDYAVESTWDEKRGVLVLAGLKRSPAVIVACDTVLRLYAWKQNVIPENLGRIVTPVGFLPWKFEDAEDRVAVDSYQNGGWTVRSAARDAGGQS